MNNIPKQKLDTSQNMKGTVSTSQSSKFIRIKSPYHPCNHRQCLHLSTRLLLTDWLQNRWIPECTENILKKNHKDGFYTPVICIFAHPMRRDCSLYRKQLYLVQTHCWACVHNGCWRRTESGLWEDGSNPNVGHAIQVHACIESSNTGKSVMHGIDVIRKHCKKKDDGMQTSGSEFLLCQKKKNKKENRSVIIDQ